MYSAREALQIGLVDEAVQEDLLAARALEVAREYAGRDAAAFAGIKELLRVPVSEQIALREKSSNKGVPGYLVFRENVGKSPEDCDKKLMRATAGV